MKLALTIGLLLVAVIASADDCPERVDLLDEECFGYLWGEWFEPFIPGNALYVEEGTDNVIVVYYRNVHTYTLVCSHGGPVFVPTNEESPMLRMLVHPEGLHVLLGEDAFVVAKAKEE